MIEMKNKTLLRNSYCMIEVLLVLSITTFMLTRCKGSSPKSLSVIAAETEENYKLNDEQKAIVRNGNEFSFKFFKKIAEDEKNTNVFVSTIGMFYSLNIINNGASGATQQEICTALKIAPTDVGRINELCRRLIIGQAKHTEDQMGGSASHMRTATLFQAGKQANINEAFRNDLEHNYFAGVVEGDIDNKRQQRIDKWCTKQTEGLFSSLPVRALDDNSAVLMVANYFKAKWLDDFDEEDTKEEAFHGGTSETVEMMNKTDEFLYAKFNDYSLLNLPYFGGYALYIFLPDKEDGLTALLQSLDGGIIRSSIGHLELYNRVFVKFPKFKVAYSFEARDYLESLGISKMFRNTSELDKIQSAPMKISEILQKTKIILDEDGTEAAAITESTFACLSERKKKKEEIKEAYFYADHPFFYIIQEPFGSYCFMGTFWGNK